MRRLLGPAAAALTLLAGVASAATPNGVLFIFNDSPAAISYLVDAGNEKTINADGRLTEYVTVGQHRLKVTGRGFTRTQNLSLSTSNAHDSTGAPGGLRWCIAVTADGSKLLSPPACFKRILS
ncbi:hypothetical protein MCEMIH16_00318 [Caulobacteraceae bacterium]